ncbi:hypothetical protein CONCODRAFT_17240 [Conidiobolus coronatus NRRL 28638]|uniref:F-box domain-containing protein n=1 Tax=Conidiobolus coronatus (strain ATCC 28846 / CBS 209.66 / NRRL 28638) TaxID=796925 RepID=A0A137P7Q6_CONC2|nr:hypothetical protein CONCODRAFT_17240 [Conidiobolus coronatus NRRL 28638]|eukprot:KXN70974.1 hypothetical protein CONCODRAFT_17240 [Conidiobolus coronatus NRRL 28638]
MNQDDQKTLYSLLCNNDFLQYLNCKDKLELDSTCKFISNNLKRYRNAGYTYKENNSSQLVIRSYYSNYPLDLISTNKIRFINNLISKYKNYLIHLKWKHSDNFYLLGYFTKKFSYLNSLHLEDIVIPKTSLKVVIQNLRYLHSLTLIDVILSYTMCDKYEQFKFPRGLSKLHWENCIQFECDIVDPLYLTRYKRTWLFNFFEPMDINIEEVTRLKKLNWFSNDKKELSSLGRILKSNLNLSSLEVSIHSLNTDITNVIASYNNNLAHLTINHEQTLDLINPFNNFTELPSIKSIEVKPILNEFTQSVNNIVLNCPNLDKLKYHTSPGLEASLLDLIVKLGNLRELTVVIPHRASFILQTNSFPELDVEHIEFLLMFPLKVNLNNFSKLRKLKSFKVSGNEELFRSDNKGVKAMFEESEWREYKHVSSLVYWKLDNH